MKAYFYKTTKNNKKFICSKFDNSYEHVTINYQRVLEFISGSFEIFPSECVQN